MANFLTKFRMSEAVQSKKNKFDLSKTTITTGDFYKNKIVYCKEIVPKEDITINMSTFTRLSPLMKPCFMRCRIVNRAFFVPMRTIMPHWNEFITDTPYAHAANGSGMFASIPTISNSFLCWLFITPANGLATTYTGTGRPDFTYADAGETPNFRFTQKGKLVYDMLLGLGYNINWTTSDTTVMSALPLLGFGKIWCDWYRNPNFKNNDINSIFESNITGSLSNDQLLAIVNAIVNLDYEKDYYTSAWLNPIAPNSDQEQPINIVDDTNLDRSSTQYYSQVTTAGAGGAQRGGTAVLQSVASSRGANNISDFLIQALHKVTDYVRRHQLVGSRALDRYMASYGIKLNSEQLKRSVYLGAHSVDVQIGDVMSNSDTTNATLGDYAGKGVGYGGNKIKFSSEEFGYLIITSTIIPSSSYNQGRDAQVKRLTCHDFFTPEFDNLGVEAIPRDMLVANYGQHNDFDNSGLPVLYSNNPADAIFGYLPRYSSYKASTHDTLSGDFVLGSKNLGATSWFCYRPVSYNAPNNADAAFNNAEFAAEDMANIWTDMYDPEGGAIDHFNLFYDFNVTSYMPMKTIFDVFDCEDKDESRETTMTIGGTQLR